MEQEEEEVAEETCQGPADSAHWAQMGNWEKGPSGAGTSAGSHCWPRVEPHHAQKGSMAGLRGVVHLTCMASKPGVLGQL